MSARKHCKDAENYTDMDTSSSEMVARKRKRKLPQRLREDERISDSELYYKIP